MLKINKLGIFIKTDIKEINKHYEFKSGLNIISGPNKSGKSTIMNSIFYALGLEELLGGQNAKALKPAVNNLIMIEGKEHSVKSSHISLEIENSNSEVITLKRHSSNDDSKKSRLVSVYNSALGEIDSSTSYKDYFLQKDSATKEFGFFLFLEDFLGLDIPRVLTFDKGENKLYLQTIMSAFFIEQLVGWTNFFSTTPKYYGIKDVKNKVVEFILGMENNSNQLKKEKILSEKQNVNNKWKEYIAIINYLLKEHCIKYEGISPEPEYFEVKNVKFNVINAENSTVSLVEYITLLNEKLAGLKSQYKKIPDRNIYEEIEDLKNRIFVEEIREKQIKNEINMLSLEASSLTKQLIKIEKDIDINKQIELLKKIGSSLDLKTADDLCPTCGNKSNDNFYDKNLHIMEIGENIKYLKAKKEITDRSLALQKNKLSSLRTQLEVVRKDIKYNNSLLEKLYEEVPVVSLEKKLYFNEFSLEKDIESLLGIYDELNDSLLRLEVLGKEWKHLLEREEKIPKDFLTGEDRKKLKSLKDTFKLHLEEFKYEKTNVNKIGISDKNYLPTIENFNIKFHTSASDFVRALWAYYISLSELSSFKNKVLVFDEPGQQNMSKDSIKKLFETLSTLKNTQSIVCHAVDEYDGDVTKQKNEITDLTKGIKFKLHFLEGKSIK